MYRPFAHDAVVLMDADGDVQAPGAAVTAALCGHWEHDPPCPLAPHHVAVERAGEEVRLRVLFVADPAAEGEVRNRIEAALHGGRLEAPGGATARWRFGGARPGSVRQDETGLARRLTQN
jgi:hypothetical protein